MVAGQAPAPFYTGTKMVYPTYDERDHSLLVTHYNIDTWERIPLTTTGTGGIMELKEFVLNPISPNPFQSSATITFELNRRQQTRLDVYDSFGRHITTLVDEVKEPGRYSIQWDGKTTDGNSPASGMVYFRMSTDGFIQTQKAIRINHR